MSAPTANHHTQAPLRSALKYRDTSRATSPALSHTPSPAPRPPLSLSQPVHGINVDDAFQPRFHSPTLISQVPLPPSPQVSTPSSLPSTPLSAPHVSLPPLIHRGTSPPPSITVEKVTHGPNSLISSTTTGSADSSALTTGATVTQSPYTSKVSFDTFENPLASMFSFTLQVKSAGYKRRRTTRVYLCAAGPDESGQEALDWALESLVQDGDELIVFRGVDEEVMEKDHDILREEARNLMQNVQAHSAEVDPYRKLSLVLEYIPGKITDSIDRLIALYRPDSLVVGTRGKRGIMGVGFGGIGSVSKYCLSHSPVPVIVVRPERKLRAAVEKRKADPKRGRHFEV